MIKVETEDMKVTIEIQGSSEVLFKDMSIIMNSLIDVIGKNLMGELYDFNIFLDSVVEATKLTEAYTQRNIGQMLKIIKEL